MLPNPQYPPSARFQYPSVPPVTSAVSCDLFAPIIAIVHREAEAFWATMPEAPIHENGDSFIRKWLAFRRFRSVSAFPKCFGALSSAQCQMILFLVLSRTQYHSSMILFTLLDNLTA